MEVVMKTVLVYLDGRTESSWQDKVMATFNDLVLEGAVTFSDSRKNPKESEKYRLIEEEKWEKADIMFAYSESFDVCLILVTDLMPKSLENPEKDGEEKWHKEATSLAEGIDILNDEIKIAILRKATSNR